MKKGYWQRILLIVLLAIPGFAPRAFASGINFTCGDTNGDTGSTGTSTFNSFATNDPNNGGFSGSLCASVQSLVGGAYSSLFTNANASIYIEFNPGVTGLLGGSTSGNGNAVTYSTYRNALIAASSGSAVDQGAIASLPATLPSVYAGGTNNTADVELTAALVQALSLSNQQLITGPVQGVEADGMTACQIGSAGCYSGFVELGAPANLQSRFSQGYYYGTGTQQGNQYNIYSIIEHEVDEILGTASCIGTQGSLSDTCSVTRGNGSTDAGVAAVDLFRYTATVSSTGAISNPSRAPFPTASVGYFSYTGGTTVDAFYNHTANGQDYSDFNSVGSGPMSSDPSYTCQYVQDAEGCLAGSPMITNDGNAEVTILDAVGFNTTASVTPEPGTMGLFGAGLALLTAVRLRRTRVKDTQR